MNNNEPEIPRVKNLAIKKRKEKENGGRKDELIYLFPELEHA